MACLNLRLLGPPHLELDGVPLQIKRRKTVALLAYLAVTRQSHTREALAALLWPDAGPSQGYANLRKALWQLNQTLGEEWLLADRQVVSLNPAADLGLDVIQFRELLAGDGQADGNCHVMIPRLTEAAALYRDHFLAGFSLKDAPQFDEWLFFEAEGLRRALARALETLVRCHSEAGQAEAAIASARRWLALDSLNEAAHYQLMLVYEQAGQHNAALRQYQECVRVLDEELGVAPQPETTALYQKLRADGGRYQLERSFTARPRVRSNLPASLTSFVGRDKEMAELKLLLAPGAGGKDQARRPRLISLTGAGGTGKTRLSLEVAAQLLDAFSGAVWLVELASLNDPSLVPQSVAGALGLREEANRSILDTLLDYLHASAGLLLILDNCEHLVAACARLAETLLSHCPNLTILASSREALAVSGEIAYQVPPLSIPPPLRVQTPGNNLQPLLQYESVRLFVERAASVLPGFTLTQANAAAVVQICCRLDGIPLAIELAVARMSLLQEEQIAARLEDRFRLLTSGSRTALPRHQTLRALVDWSYDLLTEPEQTLLRRLSVFAGGWTLAAAESICSDTTSEPASSHRILDLLASLVNKSLVVAKRQQGEETRYRLLETIRQYAQEKLRAEAKAAPISRRHLGYFLWLAEEAEPELIGPNQAASLQRLDRELDNVRAALKWSIEYRPLPASQPPLANSQGRQLAGSPIEAGLQLASALTRYWEVHNPLREGTDWLSQLLQQPLDGVSPPVRARALAALAQLKISRGELSTARSLAAESLALYRLSDDLPGIAYALSGLGYSACLLDDYESGRAALLESLAIFRELDDTFGVAETLNVLGVLLQAEEYEQARAYLLESLALCRELGHSAGIGNRLAKLGLRALWHEDYTSARVWLEEALAIYDNLVEDCLSPPEVEDCLYSLGVLSLRQAHYEQARAYFEECIVLSRDTGHTIPGLWSQVSLGYVTLRQGDEAQAHKLFAEVRQHFEKVGSKIGVVYTVEGLASLAVIQGDFRRAVRLFAWADATRQAIGNKRPPVEQADVDRDFSTIRAHLEEPAIVATYREGQALTLAEATASENSLPVAGRH